MKLIGVSYGRTIKGDKMCIANFVVPYTERQLKAENKAYGLDVKTKFLYGELADVIKESWIGKEVTVEYEEGFNNKVYIVGISLKQG